MMLIADSGSTKTEWRLVADDGSISQFRTSGVNPLFHSASDIAAMLRSELLPQLSGTKIGNASVHFYGAGCSGEEKCGRAREGIHEIFPEAFIEVEHDLLGAARALCGKEPGIACILGTGSNSCAYDGERITSNVPSLGFILGDEGSGAQIGKKFMKHYFYGELPEEVHIAFSKKYNLKKDDVLEAVYRKPNPNRYLASFCLFLASYRHEPFVVRMVHESFNEFLRHHVMKYPEHTSLKLHCTGSVGFYFADILRVVCEEHGIACGLITENPIAGLTLFHTGRNTLSNKV